MFRIRKSASLGGAAARRYTKNGSAARPAMFFPRATLPHNESFRENGRRNWRPFDVALSRSFPRTPSQVTPCQHGPLTPPTLHRRHETSDHEMPKTGSPLPTEDDAIMLCLIMPSPISQAGSLLAGPPLVQTPPSAAQSSSSFVQDQASTIQHLLYSLGAWFCPVQASTCLCTYLSTCRLPTDTAARPSQL
jgi:hypothetical protein